MAAIGRHCFRFNRIPRLFSYPPSPLELIISVNESIVRRNTLDFSLRGKDDPPNYCDLANLSETDARRFPLRLRFDLLLLFSISRANRIKAQKDLLISISAEFTSFRVLENRDLSPLSLLSLLPRVFRTPSRNEKELSSRL